MKKRTVYQRVIYCLVLVGTMFLFSGCVFDNLFNSSSSSSTQDGLPLLANTVANFPDIEVPADMSWDGGNSMVMNTNSFSGGIMKYSGRVEINSLRDFIIASMKKHQWRHVGEASYKDTLLAFTKPGKTCMVVLTEGRGGVLGNSYAIYYITEDKAVAKGTGGSYGSSGSYNDSSSGSYGNPDTSSSGNQDTNSNPYGKNDK